MPDDPAPAVLVHQPRRTPPARIVLVEPEIPNNTGSIARTCVATGCALHLVHPLGFDIDEKACRRAGLDYWPRVDLTEHADLDAWERTIIGRGPEDPGVWFFSARADQSLYEAPIRPGDRLVFGRESVGLPGALLERHPGRRLAIPMRPGERSLNLSNAVAVAVYEMVRKMIGIGAISVDNAGRLSGA
ncbi:MAG: tRNA (cytidine(34)-2'-O)-methyltransferase [Phycisphaerales bacterium]|nr:tRNA (cytidine(34)-2'-O)-methyltransferase [Phycisphaerales bacterium]